MRTSIKKTHILFVALLLSMIAVLDVTSQNVVKFKSFNNCKNLLGKSITLNEILFKPELIDIIDTIVLVVDEGDEYYFKIFSYPDFVLQKKYGPKGNGPNEINFPPVLSYVNNHKLEFFSFNKTTMFSIDISKNEPEIKTEMVLSPDLIEAQNVIILGNDIALGAGSKKGRTFYVDKDSINYYPFINATQNLPIKHMNIFNDGVLGCSPNKQYAVFASKYFHFVDIYHNGKLLLTLSNATMSEQVFMDNGRVTSDDTKLFFTSVFVTNNYFYLLYLGGKSYKELEYDINKERFSCKIQQFDFNGNPINCYAIDTPVRSFCVNEKDNTIYIINPLSEDYPLMEFSTENEKE